MVKAKLSLLKSLMKIDPKGGREGDGEAPLRLGDHVNIIPSGYEYDTFLTFTVCSIHLAPEHVYMEPSDDVKIQSGRYT